MYNNWTPSSARASAALPLTPSIALRALYERLISFRELLAGGHCVDPLWHFDGHISPPVRNRNRERPPMGDAVFNAVAQYAGVVISQSELLASGISRPEKVRQIEHLRLGRQLFTAEHALAIDLARITPEINLRQREAEARAVLSLAAYWYDRDELIELGRPGLHPLLGRRPTDEIGAVLHQHALVALNSACKRNVQGSRSASMGIEIGIAAAS